MSVISKTLAEQVAIKMCVKTKAAVDAAKVQYNECVTSEYEKQVPDDVLACYKKHPEWFSETSTIRLTGHGFSYECVTGTRRVLEHDNNAYLKLDSKISDRISKLKNKYEKMGKEYKTLVEETEQALLSLKTFKNIREHLPEAAPFLPPPISNALVVNFDSLKKKLERQPEVKAAV